MRWPSLRLLFGLSSSLLKTLFIKTPHQLRPTKTILASNSKVRHPAGLSLSPQSPFAHSQKLCGFRKRHHLRRKSHVSSLSTKWMCWPRWPSDTVSLQVQSKMRSHDDMRRHTPSHVETRRRYFPKADLCSGNCEELHATYERSHVVASHLARRGYLWRRHRVTSALSSLIVIFRNFPRYFLSVK